MARTVMCDLLQIFKSGVSAVLPGKLIRNSLQYNPVNQQLTVVGESFNLKGKNVYLVGAGKAVQNMAIEVENILGSKIIQGILSIPEGSTPINPKNKNIMYCEGAKNNLPDMKALSTAQSIQDLVKKLSADDILLVLISGGGSALLPLPKPPISLEEKIGLIKTLANAGADIKELNTVRKRLSDIKGGQLAMNADPAQVISLVLSDIVGDPLDLIASGATVENQDEVSKAIEVLNKYELFKQLPSSIKQTLTEADFKKGFPEDKVRNHIIGSNKMSIEAAVEEARKLNYLTIELSNTVTGNVKDIALEYAKLTKAFCKYLHGGTTVDELKTQLKTLEIPGLSDNIDEIKTIGDQDLCLILGGEITVEVKGMGMGGRNQQLALEFSNFIHNIKEIVGDLDIYFLSAGTDGIDGPTDAAGAIGYLDLISDARKSKMDVKEYLKTNDSYNFYKEFKHGSLHVVTGHTNTNVMDIHLIIIKRNT